MMNVNFLYPLSEFRAEINQQPLQIGLSLNESM